MTDVNCILFEGFEPLDLVGPVEVLGDIDTFHLRYFTKDGVCPGSRQGMRLVVEAAESMTPGGIVLIPGGMGTRPLTEDSEWIRWLGGVAQSAKWVLSVCTGSAVLAKTGWLRGRKATSNKRSFAWVQSVAPDVLWQPKARWVVDSNCYSASGVSAGTDMALGFVADRFGIEKAQSIARRMEYVWNTARDEDPFAVSDR